MPEWLVDGRAPVMLLWLERAAAPDVDQNGYLLAMARVMLNNQSPQDQWLKSERRRFSLRSVIGTCSLISAGLNSRLQVGSDLPQIFFTDQELLEAVSYGASSEHKDQDK